VAWPGPGCRTRARARPRDTDPRRFAIEPMGLAWRPEGMAELGLEGPAAGACRNRATRDAIGGVWCGASSARAWSTLLPTGRAGEWRQLEALHPQRRCVGSSPDGRPVPDAVRQADATIAVFLKGHGRNPEGGPQLRSGVADQDASGPDLMTQTAQRRAAGIDAMAAHCRGAAGAGVTAQGLRSDLASSAAQKAVGRTDAARDPEAEPWLAAAMHRKPRFSGGQGNRRPGRSTAAAGPARTWVLAAGAPGACCTSPPGLKLPGFCLGPDGSTDRSVRGPGACPRGSAIPRCTAGKWCNRVFLTPILGAGETGMGGHWGAPEGRSRGPELVLRTRDRLLAALTPGWPGGRGWRRWVPGSCRGPRTPAAVSGR